MDGRIRTGTFPLGSPYFPAMLRGPFDSKLHIISQEQQLSQVS